MTPDIFVRHKPLSVNQCWQGKRFKTPAYKKYERDMLLMLPALELPEGDLEVIYEFGMSNSQADWDNPIKPFQDILQKKYLFDDSRIKKATVIKTKTSKGAEFVRFRIGSYDATEMINAPIRKDKQEQA